MRTQCGGSCDQEYSAPLAILAVASSDIPARLGIETSSQFGVEYNAAMLQTIAREIAPALGWSPKNVREPVV